MRVLFGPDGARLDVPYDRNLWEPRAETGASDESWRLAVDPADLQIDPLTFLGS